MKSIKRCNLILTLILFIITTASCSSESMMGVEIDNYKFQGSWEVTGLSKFLPVENREYKNAYIELSDSGHLRLILVYKEEKSEIFRGSWEIINSKLNIHIPDLLQKSFFVVLKSHNDFELKIDMIEDLYFARIIDSYLDKYKNSENFPDSDNSSNNDDNDDNEANEEDPFMPSISVSQKVINFSYEGGESLPIKIVANAPFDVTSSNDWISYNLSDNILTISVKKNPGDQRSGKVVLKLQNYNKSAEITVSQDENFEDKVIDLGLPSGTKWCKYNLGASSIEEFGYYYTWTNAKKQTPKGYDMPSYEQASELIRYCSWTWTSVKSVLGYMGKGPNGNTIFLPAGGYYDNSVYGEKLVYVGNIGEFWTNYDNTPDYANHQSASIILFMNSAGVPPKMSGENQLKKLNIRCVKN